MREPKSSSAIGDRRLDTRVDQHEHDASRDDDVVEVEGASRRAACMQDMGAASLKWFEPAADFLLRLRRVAELALT